MQSGQCHFYVEDCLFPSVTEKNPTHLHDLQDPRWSDPCLDLSKLISHHSIPFRYPPATLDQFCYFPPQGLYIRYSYCLKYSFLSSSLAYPSSPLNITSIEWRGPFWSSSLSSFLLLLPFNVSYSIQSAYHNFYLFYSLIYWWQKGGLYSPWQWKLH